MDYEKMWNELKAFVNGEFNFADDELKDIVDGKSDDAWLKDYYCGMRSNSSTIILAMNELENQN